MEWLRLGKYNRIREMSIQNVRLKYILNSWELNMKLDRIKLLLNGMEKNVDFRLE